MGQSLPALHLICIGPLPTRLKSSPYSRLFTFSPYVLSCILYVFVRSLCTACQIYEVEVWWPAFSLTA